MTDTRPPTLPADQGQTGPPVAVLETADDAARRAGLAPASVRRRRMLSPIWLAGGLLLAATALASVLPAQLIADKTITRVVDGGDETVELSQATPYARTPAAAQPVDDRIVFGELDDVAQQFPAVGDVYFVTVTEPQQSVLSWFLGRDEPAVQFLTEEEKFGVQTPQQRRVFALESMRSSEQVAQFVALQRVGFDVSIVPGEVLVEAIVCLTANDAGTDCETWSPSDDVLDPGDRIVEVAGEEIDGVEDLSRLLAGFEPGDVVEMRIDRPEEGELDVDVELTASPDDPDRTIVGFYPFDTRAVELPFELDIDTGSIGGPSAGLAFTLTLIDELTDGELTGGGNVAVTGTMELDGTVGPIGGLRQKASAVAQAGVNVFLVPAAQGEDDIERAREAGGPDLEIIPVATLDEAITALQELGGDPIPPPPDDS